MSRIHNGLAKQILWLLNNNESLSIKELYAGLNEFSPKEIYDSAYRLKLQEYVEFTKVTGKTRIMLTPEGKFLAAQKHPNRDGVWKLIIFDIPEKQRKIRDHLRSRLIILGFKKWQSSIWVSPYTIPKEIEEELKQLSLKFFIRLIKTTEINNTSDLEKLFQAE